MLFCARINTAKETEATTKDFQVEEEVLKKTVSSSLRNYFTETPGKMLIQTLSQEVVVAKCIALGGARPFSVEFAQI